MSNILKIAAIAASVVFVGAIPALAEGDAAAGKSVFNQCKACHQVGPEAKNGVGPVLNGIVGRKAGEYPGYNYSDANKGSGLTWDEATLKEYLTDPKAKVPGTKMIFPGIKRENQLENLIAYLKLIKADGTGIE
jgi:cytochrome c